MGIMTNNHRENSLVSSALVDVSSAFFSNVVDVIDVASNEM